MVSLFISPNYTRIQKSSNIVGSHGQLELSHDFKQPRILPKEEQRDEIATLVTRTRKKRKKKSEAPKDKYSWLGLFSPGRKPATTSSRKMSESESL